MIGESLAIVLILLVIAFMYRRSGRRGLAGLALPLACVPCAWIISTALLGMPDEVPENRLYCYISIVAGLVASVALCMLVSKNIENKTARVGYLACSFVFSGALLVRYILI